jgi:hypothetical protein
MVASLCGMMGVVGVVLGYSGGHYYQGKNRYTPVA